VQAIGRIGRQVGVGTGVSLGALAGAGLGVYFGVLAAIFVWLTGGSVGPYVAVFLVFPVCVLGGGFLGAKLFLWFRALASGLRVRHRRLGALTWVLGSTLLALVALLAAPLGVAVISWVIG
jgi:hypothetical protein